MASSREQEDTLRLTIEAFKHIPGIPGELIASISAKTEAFDTELNNRFIRKMKSQFVSCIPPLRNSISWKIHMLAVQSKFKEIEMEKKELRQVFKNIAGMDGVYPPSLKERPVPEIKDTVEKIENRTYGVDPFLYGVDKELKEKELLVYQGATSWQNFYRTKVECGHMEQNDPGKRKIIFSLTSLELMKELQKRGADYDQMVKVYVDFLKEVNPNSISRINSIEETSMKDVFNVLETCVDVNSEIELINKSVSNIYRDPGDNIKLCGDSYEAKQRLLYDLRSIGVFKDTAEEKKDRESRLHQATTEYCLELMSPETRKTIMNVRMIRGSKMNPLSLADFYYEVQEIEKNHPEWRIKDRKNVRALHHLLPAQIYNTEVGEEIEDEENEEDYDNEEDDSGYYDENGEWFEYDDETTEDGDYWNEDCSYDEDDEEADITPDGSSCFFATPRQRRGAFRGRGLSRRGQSSRQRGRAPSRGGYRGTRQVNQIRGGQRRGFNRGSFRGRSGQSSSGRSGPSPNNSQSRTTHCYRCGESSHLSGQCKKFALYHSEKCPLCPKLNPSGQPVFHPRALCPYVKDGTSGFRSPRDRSPSAWKLHGFDSTGRFRTGQSPSINNPSAKN